MRRILLLASLSALVTGCMTVPLAPMSAVVVPANSITLGERFVAFKADRDIVEVRPYNGLFRSLYFVVENNDVEIYNFVVVYANGERERFDTRLVFNHGARSRYLALHGGQRRIRSIEFRYRTVGTWADGRARVVVYGVR